ncbi:MAG TPA: hypothetical protein VGO36_05300 [Solirubrobacterales bacterium]|jgi:hypothetical protein|nr:hypothetical protein [Solirubrobacterales bacterium]
MRAKLLALRAHLDRTLFSAQPGADSQPRGWKLGLLIAALLALAVVLQLARLGWSASLNSLWAEDGPIYMQAALTQGFWHAIVSTYATYLVVVPRLIGELASLAPLRDVPAAVSILSGLVVGLSGLVVWQASAAHIRSPWLRGTLVALTVLSPVAGLESVDSAAYVPWYMLFACFWLLLWPPRTTRGAILGGVFLLLTGLSTPGLWFFAPLAGLRALAARDRRDLALLAGYGAGALAQVPVLALTDETAVTPIWSSDIWTTYLQRVVDGTPFGLRLGGHAWEHLGWPLLIALVLAGLALLAVGWRSTTPAARWIAAIALPTSLVMFVVSLYQRALGEQMVWAEGLYNNGGSRYAIVPALLLVSAGFVLIEGARERYPRAKAPARVAIASVALLAVALVSSFWVREISVRGAPPWDTALTAAAAQCPPGGAGAATIQTSPPGFGMSLPCEQLDEFRPPAR